jgi:cellulase/cellobiase CelA1
VSGICQQPTGQVTASLSKTADWGSGYCVTLLVTNHAAQSTTSWSVTVNTRASTIYDSWNGNFPASTGTFTITPGFSWNQSIPAGATNNSVGFCANRTPANSGAVPVVVSASGSF